MTGEDKTILSLFTLFTACPIKHLQITILPFYKEAANQVKMLEVREDVIKSPSTLDRLSLEGRHNYAFWNTSLRISVLHASFPYNLLAEKAFLNGVCVWGAYTSSFLGCWKAMTGEAMSCCQSIVFFAVRL